MKNLDKSKLGNLTEKQKEIIEKIRERSKGIVDKEFLKISFRCSRLKKDFVVSLKKKGDELYEIEKIFQEESLILSNQTSSFLLKEKEKPLKESKIEINKIKNWEDLECPHCKAKGIIKCSCNKLCCDGGMKEENSKHLYKCPWCECTAYVEGIFDTMEGEESKEKRFLRERGKELSDKREVSDLLLPRR